MPDAHSPQTCGGPALLGSRLVEGKEQGGERRGGERRGGEKRREEEGMGRGERDGRGAS